MESIFDKKFQQLSVKEMEIINGGKLLGWTNQGDLITFSTGPNYPASMDATGYRQEYEILWIGTGRERTAFTDTAG